MITILLAVIAFILGSVFSEEVNVFFRKVANKMASFRKSAINEEIIELRSEVSSLSKENARLLKELNDVVNSLEIKRD